MKLWLTSDNVDWVVERYHYAAEQMMLTLFPGERPEYPEGPPPQNPAEEDNAAIFTLHRGKKLTDVSVLVFRSQGYYNGVARFSSEKLDRPRQEVYHTVQHALKIAFYKAGTALLGASGIVFMMILLSSFGGGRNGTIPTTLILVAVFYLGGELWDAIFVRDNVSQLTHIIGGLCGTVLGFALSGRR